jgi:hypothetical protein
MNLLKNQSSFIKDFIYQLVFLYLFLIIINFSIKAPLSQGILEEFNDDFFGFIKAIITTFSVTFFLCGFPITSNIIFFNLFQNSKQNKVYRFSYFTTIFLINLLYLFIINYLFISVFTMPILFTMLLYIIYKFMSSKMNIL